jgi:hypothetical protein
MALQPSLRPQVIIGQYDAIHTLDIFCTNKVFIYFYAYQYADHIYLIYKTVNYVCPFRFDLLLLYECITDVMTDTFFYSAKMANKIETIVKPLLGPGGKYEGKVKVIVRLHAQPWHATSTFTSEAGLAVRSLTY